MDADRARKLALWDDFCRAYQIMARRVRLFATHVDGVAVSGYGRDNRPILQRSSDMDALVIAETTAVLEDFERQTDRYEGLIYMMFWDLDGRVLPLYIGKAEKFGRHGGNLSANIADIRHNHGKFARWGYGYAYHIGDLSAVTLPGHPPERATEKYQRWARQLFTAAPTEQPQLKQAAYFWMRAWKRGDIGIWPEYGATSLTFLEYLLIGVASDLFPRMLLNDEGVNRR